MIFDWESAMMEAVNIGANQRLKMSDTGCKGIGKSLVKVRHVAIETQLGPNLCTLCRLSNNLTKTDRN